MGKTKQVNPGCERAIQPKQVVNKAGERINAALREQIRRTGYGAMTIAARLAGYSSTGGFRMAFLQNSLTVGQAIAVLEGLGVDPGIFFASVYQKDLPPVVRQFGEDAHAFVSRLRETDRCLLAKLRPKLLACYAGELTHNPTIDESQIDRLEQLRRARAAARSRCRAMRSQCYA